MSGHTRPPAAAGLFYPALPAELAAVVDALLAAAQAGHGPAPRALIVPHAGYAYSGPVAAVAYATLGRRTGEVRRIVLLGPSHFVPLRGAAVPEAGAWETPLGIVPVAEDMRAAALRAGAVRDDLPHGHEHALEVQLPFLQRALRAPFSILPVAVGELTTSDAADLVGALWDGEHTVVVVSTDLSHYLDDEAARALDRRTARAILELRPEEIEDRAACGCFALRGLLEHARREGLVLEQLALATSADTSGDRSRVVGYGAFALAAPA